MNINEYDNKIFGIPQGVSYGQFERVDELNDRMYDRNTADDKTVFDPKFDIIGSPTRRSVFPILDMKKIARTKINEKNFNTEKSTQVFVETESKLRNQYYSLQNGAEQSIFVPSSKSDLYNVKIPIRSDTQPFKCLFEKNSYFTQENEFIKNSQVGKDFFNNSTKTQLLNSV